MVLRQTLTFNGMMLDVWDIGLGAEGLAGDSKVLRCSQ